MASELIASLGPNDMYSEKAMGYDDSIEAVLGVNQSVRGVSFPKDYDSRSGGNKSIASYTGVFYIPKNLTLAANVSFIIHFQGDGTNEAADVGGTAVFGVTTKVLNSSANDMNLNVSTANDAYMGVEQTATAALGTATSAGLPLASCGLGSVTIAVATGSATFGSGAATGKAVAYRIRRIGTATADNLPGRLIVPLVHVLNA